MLKDLALIMVKLQLLAPLVKNNYIMKNLNRILFVIPFILFSCASPYLKNYEPILTFLETQKLDKHKNYVLQMDKKSNTEPLRLFNGTDGLAHYFPKKTTHDTFHSKH
jgi:hypothetical protein